MTIKTAERAISQLLKDLAGGRVYALVAPKHPASPFIVYQTVGEERWRSINGPSGVAQNRVQVDVYAEDFYAAKDLAAQIEELLDGYRGSVAFGTNSPPDQEMEIVGISLQDGHDMLDQTEEPVFFRSLRTYLVTFQQ